MSLFKIQKHSRAGRILDAVATVFFGLGLLTGFVCMVAGMMYLTDAPRDTPVQAALMAAVFVVIVYVVGSQVIGFMDSERGEEWSPWPLTATILYTWMPMQAILVTWLADPAGMMYRNRLVPLMILAALVFAAAAVALLDSLYRALAGMVMRARRGANPDQADR